jgi:hypothetical protein
VRSAFLWAVYASLQKIYGFLEMVENHIHKALHREKKSRKYGERERERGRERKNFINCVVVLIFYFMVGVTRMFSETVRDRS